MSGFISYLLYPIDDLRESNSRPAELVISFFNNPELWALKLPVTTEQIGNSLFMLLRSVSKFGRNFEIHHDSGLDNDKSKFKNIFHLWTTFCE